MMIPTTIKAIGGKMASPLLKYPILLNESGTMRYPINSPAPNNSLTAETNTSISP